MTRHKSEQKWHNGTVHSPFRCLLVLAMSVFVCLFVCASQRVWWWKSLHLSLLQQSRLVPGLGQKPRPLLNEGSQSGSRDKKESAGSRATDAFRGCWKNKNEHRSADDCKNKKADKSTIIITITTTIIMRRRRWWWRLQTRTQAVQEKHKNMTNFTHNLQTQSSQYPSYKYLKVGSAGFVLKIKTLTFCRTYRSCCLDSVSVCLNSFLFLYVDVLVDSGVGIERRGGDSCQSQCFQCVSYFACWW